MLSIEQIRRSIRESCMSLFADEQMRSRAYKIISSDIEAKLLEQGGNVRIGMYGPDDFEIGEYVIYRNGAKYELGRIKSLYKDGAFVAYSEGETGAKTPYDTMHKLVNSYTIQDTTLGGNYF